MDVAGWHAQRRADKESQQAHRHPGQNNAHVDRILPMDESFIGGFHPSLSYSDPGPPVPPLKDLSSSYPYDAPVVNSRQNYKEVDHIPRPPPSQRTISTAQLSHMTAVQRSKILRVARMDPHLQFMCGPLLKYDTVDEQGLWRGAALIVTADSGSIYEPAPSLTYSYDPSQPVPTRQHQHHESQTIHSRFQSTSDFSTAHSRSFTASTIDSPVDYKNGNLSYSNVNSTANANGHTRTQTAKPYNSNPSRKNLPASLIQTPKSFELGPHPADPHSTILPTSPGSAGVTSFTPSQHNPHSNDNSSPTSSSIPHSNANGNGTIDDVDGIGVSKRTREKEPDNRESTTVVGKEIWVYAGQGGTFTFWRFHFTIPLVDHEMCVQYSVNKGQQLEFWVPGVNENMRWAGHSCNGFSSGVNPDDFRGPGFRSGYDPVWMDLLSKHAETPFHVLVGGGDQLYCDPIMREPELQGWVTLSNPEDRKACPLTPEMEFAMDRFFFNHYCQAFRNGAFARANCSIPMLNMCDDHDLIDGFGSYPDDLQKAPVFRRIGARGYFFFLLFQCFINVEVDGIEDAPGKHIYKSLIIGEPGPYVLFPSHSFLPRLGPKVHMLLLDCRAERTKERVCSAGEYERVFARLNALPAGVEHLVIQVGIPIAYPRMVFLEAALESKYNPLIALGRAGTFGLGSFVNKFNNEAELLDDLNDHWTATGHKRERNWFVEQIQNFAMVKRIRVSFISGDVHCAAVGVFKTLKTKGKQDIDRRRDHRYMVNIITSAIVNTPPPNGVIAMVSSLASKVHKTMHSVNTDETMIPIFTRETTGGPRKQKFIMGKRNWCRVEWDEETGDIIFDIRVEKEKGCGVTVGYSMNVPRPGW